MIIHPAPQGSPEWLAARAGRPTASAFERIMSPVRRKPSSAQGRYLCRLLAERFGQPPEDFSSAFMARGSAMEAEAVAYYEFTTGRTTQPVGLCLTDDMRIGASPDRLVGEDGLLEVKCVSFENHLMALSGMLDEDHKCQCQGQMMVTGRRYVDQLYYSPALPSKIIAYTRDDEFIADLETNVRTFCAWLDATEKGLREQYGDVFGSGRAMQAAQHTEGAPDPLRLEAAR